MKSIVLASVLSASILGVTAAQAATTTTGSSATVKLSVVANCTATSPGNVTFSNSDGTSAPADATATMSVTCTNGVAYKAYLTSANEVGTDNVTRTLKGTTTPTNTISYQILNASSSNTAIGNSATASPISATGTGSAQSTSLAFRVTTYGTPAVDDYTDTVTLAVEY